MSKEEMRQQEARETLAMESDMTEQEELDYVAGFLKAAEMLKEETKTIRIERKGQLLFSFKIHALSEQDMTRAQKMATTYTKNKNKKLPDVKKDFDKALGTSCLIYLATVDEDRQRLWDNVQLKNALMSAGILSKDFVGMGYDLIDKVLSPGEKNRVIEEIDKLCGYSEDEDEYERLSDIDLAKN